MKRRHFNVDDSGNSHMQESLEWMRINAERERIQRFKTVAKDTATVYYKIMDRIAKQLIETKQQKPSASVDPLSQDGDDEEKEKNEDETEKK